MQNPKDNNKSPRYTITVKIPQPEFIYEQNGVDLEYKPTHSEYPENIVRQIDNCQSIDSDAITYRSVENSNYKPPVNPKSNRSNPNFGGISIHDIEEDTGLCYWPQSQSRFTNNYFKPSPMRPKSVAIITSVDKHKNVTCPLPSEKGKLTKVDLSGYITTDKSDLDQENESAESNNYQKYISRTTNWQTHYRAKGARKGLEMDAKVVDISQPCFGLYITSSRPASSTQNRQQSNRSRETRGSIDVCSRPNYSKQEHLKSSWRMKSFRPQTASCSLWRSKYEDQSEHEKRSMSNVGFVQTNNWLADGRDVFCEDQVASRKVVWGSHSSTSVLTAAPPKRAKSAAPRMLHSASSQQNRLHYKTSRINNPPNTPSVSRPMSANVPDVNWAKLDNAKSMYNEAALFELTELRNDIDLVTARDQNSSRPRSLGEMKDKELNESFRTIQLGLFN